MMMGLARKIVAMFAAFALIFSAYSSFPANASDMGGLSRESSSLGERYSDKEILRLLLDGTGPIADENPRLLERLNFSDERPLANEKLLLRVIDDYLEYHSDFEEEVVIPLTSGNPYKVELALTNLTENYFSMMNEKYGVSNRPMVTTSGCPAGAKVCVVVFAVAVANAAVYANAAVATFAAVALAIVPAAISYLMDSNSVDGDLVKTELIAEFTKAMAS
ncbi:hypothetical protein A7979_11505 [Rothia nasimurium]|uniref:Sporulation delaying protein family toxin n=2 Tax=Bacteria TaxID=2 RepID=A0A1Y1RPX0_9MICC|nr:hypothetical protein A7979_11505 [Rothia nasimurium]